MIDLRMAALAAAMTTAVAVAPALAQQSGRNPATSPMPQAGGAQQGEVSDALVQKVGAALRQTSAIRQQYSQRAQSENSSQRQQELTSQAQVEMVKAISDQGLSVQQYNQVLQMAQADPTLRQRLLSVAQSGG
ncbi:MAG TPA: DUF4168 domain-containing protein [Acetobacteraceae bacterium]|jgi:hypothetical protein|nr:DUF4168 domain-containing protein [Acetobacteraceae bacterium]